MGNFFPALIFFRFKEEVFTASLALFPNGIGIAVLFA